MRRRSFLRAAALSIVLPAFAWRFPEADPDGPDAALTAFVAWYVEEMMKFPVAETGLLNKVSKNTYFLGEFLRLEPGAPA